ncbi:chemotaxis protein CheW [Jiella pacifica]|uniref:Chemotaxis protein CheW n=1 Tax=Jiella pacifica TaxID=2696469 RepID=A0A6N9T2J2_9HYPH|nr:chemotaxis protein CheW [Jiella pacifica]NDW05583.1 chemotaxis protein CheW [Jiella pacifica]
MNQIVQYLTFGVAEDLFAAPVGRVREILDLAPISRLPRSPAELLGMIDVRGASVPVVDARRLLGLEETTDTTNTRIVVLTIMRRSRETVFGLKTDRVFEVTSLDEGALEAPPEIGAGNWNAGAITGIGRRNGAFVTVFDVDRLFDAVDSAQGAIAA